MILFGDSDVSRINVVFQVDCAGDGAGLTFIEKIRFGREKTPVSSPAQVLL
jgi:hypothetical protein